MMTTPPRLEHWALLEEIQLMTPEQFVQFWDISHQELAELCCCSYSTVTKWFTRGPHKRKVDTPYMRILALTHNEWLNLSQQPSYLHLIRRRSGQKLRRFA